MQPPATCSHCGLALASARAAGPGYCCVGCEIAALVVQGWRGARSGEAAPLLVRLGLATFLSMNVMMVAFALWGATPAVGLMPAWVSLLRWLSLLLSIPALALLLPPLAAAGFARLSARALRVELLVVAASLAAFAVSTVNTIRERGEIWFDSATMVPLVVLIGSWLAARARSRARDDVERLFAAAPLVHRVRRRGAGGFATLEVAEAELEVGDEIELAAGARVPVDGVVLAATSARLDASLLTGEPLPREVAAGEFVRAGEAVRSGFLILRSQRVGEDSTLGRLRAALARALANPPRTLRAVDGAGRLLVAATASLALFVVAWLAWRGEPLEGLHRALALLVVACPCSIGLAAPLTMTRALGAAARLGAVVRSLEGLEQLGRVDLVAADKTGTLTSGEPGALETRIEPIGGADAGETRALAIALAKGSTHPLAQALRGSASEEPLPELTALVELPGKGVLATTAEGREARLGRRDFALAGGGAESDGAADPDATLSSILSLDGRPLARVLFHERPRAGIERLGQELAARGVDLVVLSGDADARARRLAQRVGGRGRGDLDPQQKAEELARMARDGRRVAWLFDGANDAVALASAPVSIAVDRKLEWLADAADVVLLGERVGALPRLIDLARRARRRVVAALAWAALYHAGALTLGALGLLTPASAALVMAAGSLAVVKASLAPLAGASAAGPGEAPSSLPASAPDAALPRLKGATP